MGTGSFTDNRASMTDETGSVGLIHNCTNGRTLVNSSSGYIPEASFTQRNPASPFGKAVTTLGCSYLPQTVSNVLASPHLGMSDGSSVALSRVPSVAKELLSGLNSLYELKDCQALIKLIPFHFIWAAARGARRESLQAFNEWTSHVRETVKSPLGIFQVVAGADLMWKFGIKPLISDINQVHNTLDSINRKVNELLNKKFTVAGRFTDKRSDYYEAISGNHTETLGMFSRSVATNHTTVKTWVCGATKRIDPSRLPGINVLKLRTTAESLGLSLDATDLWEAVPYSFVVDWFLPIQAFLEQFGRAYVDPSWLLTEGSWTSVKTTSTGISREVITPLTSANCVVESFSGLNRYMTYERTDYTRTKLTSLPANFPSTYIPQPSWPSFDQGITGIELLLQRIKRTLT
jgi:hypothetical protein